MKKSFLLLCFMLFPFVAMASEVTPVNIVVVDIQQLMGASKAAKSIQSQSKSLRDKYQKQITSIEKDLKKSEEKVIEAGKAGDKEAFMKARKKFQTEVMESQKDLAELNSKLDKAVGVALNKLRDEIVEIVGDLSTDRGYDLVISRADVVIVSKEIDITAEVMKKLNSRLNTIKVKG